MFGVYSPGRGDDRRGGWTQTTASSRGEETKGYLQTLWKVRYNYK